jgi:hypothetical protein
VDFLEIKVPLIETFQDLFEVSVYLKLTYEGARNQAMHEGRNDFTIGKPQFNQFKNTMTDLVNVMQNTIRTNNFFIIRYLMILKRINSNENINEAEALTLFQNQLGLKQSKEDESQINLHSEKIDKLLLEISQSNHSLWNAVQKDTFLYKYDLDMFSREFFPLVRAIENLHLEFKNLGLDSDLTMHKTKKKIQEREVKAKEEANRKLESNSDCFVATAVYKSTYHPNVIALREFRDSRLNQFILGRGFIKIYYLIGPFLSKLVKKSKVLTAISKKFIDYIVIKISL